MKKTFNPEKYGMIVCPSCIGNGFIQNPERQCCPQCGGFGFVRKEVVQEENKKIFKRGADGRNQTLLTS
jgi:DnaJ-class molecular chaperone